MADFISAITPNTDLSVSDFDGRGPGTSTDLATGHIRESITSAAGYQSWQSLKIRFFDL